MKCVLGAFLIASLIRMGEEYFYPGGFTDVMKHPKPEVRVADDCARDIHYDWCTIASRRCRHRCWEKRSCFQHMAGLLFFNGLMPTMGRLTVRRYAPGLVLVASLSVRGYEHWLERFLVAHWACCVNQLRTALLRWLAR